MRNNTIRRRSTERLGRLMGLRIDGAWGNPAKVAICAKLSSVNVEP